MSDSRWQRIEEIFHQAAELAPEARPAFLDQACGGDEALRKEVESLLVHDAKEGGTLAKAVAEAAEGGVSLSADLSGRSIGPYKVLGRIGKGGMGVVYKARDSRLGRDVALKVLPAEVIGDASRRQRFETEARAAAALNHPNIVAVFDLGTEGGVFYIVSELVDGEPLCRTRLGLRKALGIAIQIAGGLAAVHEAGIVHRDLKPDNILLTRDGRVKILDFGLAQVRAGQVDVEAATQTLTVRTEPGMVMGTAGYMSPEQAEGKPVDARSDVFSFGSVLYEMLSGRKAFKGDSAASTLVAILHDDPAPLGDEVPRDLERIVTLCLRKDPARRWHSMVEVKVALEDVKAESESGRPAAAEKPKSALARLWWAAGLLIAGILVTGLWPVPAPTARVTQLTHGGRPWSMAVHGGRILYATDARALDHSATKMYTEFWSISTQGGEPRREGMPFLNLEDVAWPNPVDTRQGVILIFQWAAGATQGEMWLAEFDGSKPRRIAETLNGSSYSVSPDLKTLLRSAKEGLFARPVDGGPERLVARIDWKQPSDTFWHPSGERIGFSLLKDGPAKLWEVRTDGTSMRPLLPQFQAEQTDASWSPNGERLYFVSRRELWVRGSRRWLGWMRPPRPQRLTAGSVGYGFSMEDPTDPHVIYAQGSMSHGELMKLNRQTDHFEPYLDGLSADGLDYSPDGQWIAYVSYPGRELWKCRRDGSDKVLLEDGLLTDKPRWSPDGKRLAFAALRKGSWGEPHRIYTIDPNGGKAELVKGVNGPGFDPTWSPDGKKLLFAPWDYALVPKRDRHISIVDLESGAVRMVPGSEEMTSSRWSPDGKHLVALRWGDTSNAIYDFGTGRWTDVDVKDFGFQAWSKDSKYVYGIAEPDRLLRVEVATRKLEKIRSIEEFRLAGNMVAGVSWTPDMEPVILADQSTSEIYRIERDR
jgi:WD40 repeat protein/tRNA A-37 threonylcarbamoyl transferase component Bud32